MDIPENWGLPPGFAPVRFAISDDAKSAARGVLDAGEPVIVSVANEESTVTILATPRRILSIKTQELGAGAGGFVVKSFPFEGIFDLKVRPQTFNVSLALDYRSNDGGKTVETGRRAKLAKARTDTFMAFPQTEGEAAFAALLHIWNWKKAQPSADG